MPRADRTIDDPFTGQKLHFIEVADETGGRSLAPRFVLNRAASYRATSIFARMSKFRF